MGVTTYLLDDGTFDVRTDDKDPYLAETRAKDLAAVEQALAHFRRRGEPRPVLFQIVDGGHLNPVPENAVPVPCLDHPALTRCVMSRSDARGVLERPLGKQARRWFRIPTWPSGYWTVTVHRDGHVELLESRTPSDEASDLSAAA
jgi:hypothetical protein